MSGYHPSHRPGSSPVFGSFHREEYEGNWTPDEDTPEPCPMGCGRTTDDVAGGPCSKCWDEAPRDGRQHNPACPAHDGKVCVCEAGASGSEEAVTRHIEEEMLVESVLPIRLQDCGRFHRDGECPPLPRG